MQTNVTFETMPQAVSVLLSKVENLERFILNKPQTPEQPELMTAKQAALLLNLSVYTLYTKVSKRELSSIKQGKQLRFKRSELLAYIESGRRKTQTEIESEVNQTLAGTKKGRV